MKYIYIIILLIITISCSELIIPPYTNVEKLADIKMGMSIEQVNSELGIEPYDVYFKGEGDFVVIYNYRVKNRLVNNSSNRHNETSQTNGREWYGQAYFCYIYLNDNKVKSIITDEGKIKSENILIKNNNLFLIQKNEIGFHKFKKDSMVFTPINN